VLNITTEASGPEPATESVAPKKASLKRYLLEKLMGDREKADLWESVFRDLAERGLNLEAVELGIMDDCQAWNRPSKGSFPDLRRNAARSTPKPTPAGACGRRSESCFRRA